jgi:hypothetical protein
MQGVLVFASAAARDAAITSPQEGQCCYLKDTDAVLTYSGAAWVGFDDSNAIQNSIVDAKGDLVAASAADTPARLAVGANDTVLVAASGETTGLKWSGAWTTWTPTVSNLSIGNGTGVYRYAQIGKTIFIDIQITLGSTSTVSGSPYITLPVNSAYNTFAAAANYEDNGVQYWFGVGYVANNGVSFKATNTTGTYAFSTEVSATIPFTWGTSDKINCQFSYESV